MNNQNNQVAVSDKAILADTDLDQISGGGVLREVVRTPPAPKPAYASGGVTHEDFWNTQT